MFYSFWFKFLKIKVQKQINCEDNFQKKKYKRSIIFHINWSKNYFLDNIICLKCSVKVIDMVVIGIEKQILKNPPLNNAKNPSFLIRRLNPWNAFPYPKTESCRRPPVWATSALWICILSFTISKGVVKYPAMAPAIDEQRMLSDRVWLFLSFTKISFIFSKEAKKIALNGPKNSKVAPKAWNKTINYSIKPDYTFRFVYFSHRLSGRLVRI